MPVPLAVSLGDPAGVGPELLTTAWAAREVHALPPFMAVCGANLLAAAALRRGLTVPIRPISDPAEAAEVFPHAFPVLDSADSAYRPGEPDREGAELALRSLTLATRSVPVPRGQVEQAGA